MTFVYILLFVVCLSTLIMVHEAGHLATAKIFKVYCFEYSIGFGPKIFSVRRKGTETAFSMRWIPFGGFVSMYGEDEAIPEGHEPIDPSRSLNAVKKWKKCIILVAGVVMNFILAITIFFLYEVAFPAHTARVAHITVNKGSIAYEAGLRSQDFVYTPILETSSATYIFYDDDAVLEYQDSSSKQVYFGYNYTNITLKDTSLYTLAIAFGRVDFGHITNDSPVSITYEDAINGDFTSVEDVQNIISGYYRASAAKKDKETSNYIVRIAVTENYLDEQDKVVYGDLVLTKEEYKTFKFVPSGAPITLVGDFSTKQTKKGVNYNVIAVNGADNFETSYPDTTTGNILNAKSGGVKPNKLSFSFYKLNEETNIGRGEQMPINDLELSSNGKLPKKIGVSMQLDSYHNKFGDALKYTFEDFGKSATIIVRGLGTLFSKEGWKNVGGIIAIGVSTTQVLQQNGFGLFLFYWALISVNLGIVNLLPFPGLDGWQLLVTAVEGISRKTIPTKVKSIVSAVGIGLLFILMILIIIKDLIAVV